MRVPDAVCQLSFVAPLAFSVSRTEGESQQERRQHLSLPRFPFCGRVRKEGNILFHDALNTFYLRLYGVGHMVKNHSDSERVNLLPPHVLLFPINSKVFFICIRQDNTYHGLCYTSRGALSGTRSAEENPYRIP